VNHNVTPEFPSQMMEWDKRNKLTKQLTYSIVGCYSHANKACCCCCWLQEEREWFCPIYFLLIIFSEMILLSPYTPYSMEQLAKYDWTQFDFEVKATLVFLLNFQCRVWKGGSWSRIPTPLPRESRITHFFHRYPEFRFFFPKNTLKKTNFCKS